MAWPLGWGAAGRTSCPRRRRRRGAGGKGGNQEGSMGELVVLKSGDLEDLKF